MRNKEMDSYKTCRVFNLPQTKLQTYVKDGQESSSEASETLLGAEHCACKKQLYTNDNSDQVMEMILVTPQLSGSCHWIRSSFKKLSTHWTDFEEKMLLKK
jgi:hypothetical protein